MQNEIILFNRAYQSQQMFTLAEGKWTMKDYKIHHVDVVANGICDRRTTVCSGGGLLAVVDFEYESLEVYRGDYGPNNYEPFTDREFAVWDEDFWSLDFINEEENEVDEDGFIAYLNSLVISPN